MQSPQPFVIEKTYTAPVERVWKAITDKNQMKHWYFDLDDFKPEPGFEFRFDGGTENKVYHHVCKVEEVIPYKKLKYSWRYDGYPGISYLSFELFDEGATTRLRLTHEGLETFPRDNPDFGRESFTQGWTHITGISLRDYLETTGEQTG